MKQKFRYQRYEYKWEEKKPTFHDLLCKSFSERYKAITPELVPVKAMGMPIGKLFYMDFVSDKK